MRNSVSQAPKYINIHYYQHSKVRIKCEKVHIFCECMCAWECTLYMSHREEKKSFNNIVTVFFYSTTFLFPIWNCITIIMVIATINFVVGVCIYAHNSGIGTVWWWKKRNLLLVRRYENDTMPYHNVIVICVSYTSSLLLVMLFWLYIRCVQCTL